MFETIKMKIRQLTAFCKKGADQATTHRALYVYLAGTYYLGCVGMIEKDTVAQIVTAIYFSLAGRG